MPQVTRLFGSNAGSEPAAAAHHAARPGRRDFLQEVTDKIVEALETAGELPWLGSWDSAFRWPTNPTTGRPYHGINVLLLATAGYQDPRWCSYKQAQARGWQVRKGEKGTPIYFYKVLEREEIDKETGEPVIRKIPMMRTSYVFNLSQMEGAPAYEFQVQHKSELDAETIALCDEIIQASGVKIQYGTRRAAYSPSRDIVYMPYKESFDSDHTYYAVKLHELAHWTGHSSRLNRVFGTSRESVEYAKEELRAEIASAMLSMRLGLPAKIPEHAAYIEQYLRILKNDKREIFRAAKDAEAITRYVLSFSPKFRAEFEEEHRRQIAEAVENGAPEDLFDAGMIAFDEDEDDLDLPAMRVAM